MPLSVSLAPDITSTRTPGGMILLNTRTGRYWQLNETGALILEHLLAGGSCTSAVAELRIRHPEAADRVEADTKALLSSLKSAKLVTS
ncbi:lasso peptide biosynthesis PqqD family chaperone [Streptomyces halobius]|uniref:Lasso peptide biosynthesis PqqD family chaperone n=1 Tax=Streptomyces halobius TaxID=2879846 RepID=A0ABY4MEI5_9ACTN|nr:lasso peptide biosynthesis PqqD family chaperone [Streptomyces halobius]UQA95159.1 lasso peptide biosynthesis PqqD family chaperone [Streptomyces halobius]